MKNSVNNKTFDEIFAQRGEQVQPENLVVDKIYLFERLRAHVEVIGKLYNPRKDSHVLSEALFRSGHYHTNMLGRIYEIDLIFEATPDQIDLLNSYR